MLKEAAPPQMCRGHDVGDLSTISKMSQSKILVNEERGMDWTAFFNIPVVVEQFIDNFIKINIDQHFLNMPRLFEATS